jgi:hypothetical protein
MENAFGSLCTQMQTVNAKLKEGIFLCGGQDQE